MRSLRWVFAALGLVAGTPSQAQTQDPVQQWTLPAGGLLNGSKAVIENGPCCGASRGAAAVTISDAAFLATLPGMASRDGGTLRLKLAGDRFLKLTDCSDQPACEADDTRLHRLVAWWPKHRTYVVAVALYEESVAYLVAEKDGNTLETTAPPILSPSGRQAVALTSNLMSGVDLEIIDLGRDPPTLAKVTAMPDCGGAGPDSFLRPTPVWLDESQVTFTGVSAQPGDNPDSKQLLRIEGGKPSWQC
jgi:hypothetical protein